jgi:diaminopimelate epimerase
MAHGVIVKSLKYHRYSATGNFLLVSDCREIDPSDQSDEFWAQLCEKNNADGIVLIKPSSVAEVKMEYRNRDGGEVDLCGNGLRALTYHLRNQLKEGEGTVDIETNKGRYIGQIEKDEVKVQMTELYDIGTIDLTSFYDFKEGLYLNTGVPHCVFLTDDVDKIAVDERGKQISKNRRFKKESNVNFVEIIKDNELKIRTYERGVEKETLSCGTGAMACAVAMAKLKSWKNNCLIHTKGGDLFTEYDENFDHMSLRGQVDHLSQGEEDLPI